MTAPEIQQEIERTQDHLGETVDELAARADVKARARARAASMKDKAAEMSGQLRQSQVAQSQLAQGDRCGAAGRSPRRPWAPCSSARSWSGGGAGADRRPWAPADDYGQRRAAWAGPRAPGAGSPAAVFRPCRTLDG